MTKQRNTPPLSISTTLLDKAIEFFSPKIALNRYKDRLTIQAMDNNGLIVPGMSKRTMRAWNPTEKTADQELLPKLSSIRAASRDLYANTPLATAALRRARTNIVGYGLSLQSHIDRTVLNLTEEQAAEWERNTEAEFSIWAEDQNCDSARQLMFADLQSLAVMSVLMNGDCFVALPIIPRKGVLYNTRVQLIEADYCSNPHFNADTRSLSGGVEIDNNGAVTHYHFRIATNEYLSASTQISDKWQRVPAFGEKTGKRNILHLFDKERVGQHRGIAMLAPVFEELKQITRLSKAEIDAAVINSFFTVFVKSQSPQMDGLGEGYVPLSDDPLSTDANAEHAVTDSSVNPSDEKIYEMGSGNVIDMAKGDEIQLADPKRPNANFEPFFLAIVKQIGAAIEIPFEQLLLYFSSSYTAARGAILEAWKFYRARRVWLARYFCQPVYEAWLSEAIMMGRISAPGFFTDSAIRKAWVNATWTGPGQGQLDPLKETESALLAIEGNLSSHEDEFASRNTTLGTWEETVTRKGREKSFLESHGLTIYEKKISNASGQGSDKSDTNVTKEKEDEEE